MKQSYDISASIPVNVPFDTKGIYVANPTANWVYIRVGGNDIPTSVNADYRIPPYSYYSNAPQVTRNFGIGVGLSSGSSMVSGTITVEFYDYSLPAALGALGTPTVVAAQIFSAGSGIMAYTGTPLVFGGTSVTRNTVLLRCVVTSDTAQHISIDNGNSVIIATGYIAANGNLAFDFTDSGAAQYTPPGLRYQISGSVNPSNLSVTAVYLFRS